MTSAIVPFQYYSAVIFPTRLWQLRNSATVINLDSLTPDQLPTITERAARTIRGFMELLPEQEREVMIAVVGWVSWSSRRDPSVPGPNMGAHYRAKVPENLIIRAHGIEVGYGMGGEFFDRYLGTTLDFVDGKFVFVERSPDGVPPYPSTGSG